MSDACAQSRSLNKIFNQANPDALQSALSQPLSYAPRQGSKDLRESLSEFHAQSDPDHYMTFCGAQEALFCCLAAILEKEDEVITFSPVYPPLMHSPTLLGAKVTRIPLKEENQWQIDLDHLKQSISPRTKVIIINQPHNPTGATLSEQDSKRLRQLVAHSGCYLFADEVAIHSQTDDQTTPSIYQDNPKIIGFGVSSKSLGLPGLRIGWAIISNPMLRQKCLNIKSHLSICTSRSDELLFRLCLQHSDAIIKENNAILGDNTQAFEILCKRLSQQTHWVKPAAGLLSLVKCTKVGAIEPFAKALVAKTGILILPASYLGLEGPYFRLGLGASACIEHLPKFEAFLSAYSAEHGLT